MLMAGTNGLRWLAAIAALVLLAGMFGGTLVDVAGMNFYAVRSMKGETGAGSDLEESDRLTASGKCRERLQIGRDILLAGDYALAVQPLQAAVECSDDPWAWYYLGSAQYALNDLEGAVNSWRHSPDGYHEAVLLAAATTQQNDVAATIAAWQFTSDINPNEQLPYIRLAKLNETANPEQVEPLLLQAIAADPQSPAAFIELGTYYQMKGDPGAAQFQFEQALEIDPSNVLLLVMMADNATELGDVPRAIDLWQEVALRNERRRGRANFEIGSLAFADGNYSSALAFFKRAVEINPENAEFLAGLAGGYVEAGCRQLAISTFQLALDSAESEVVKGEIEQRLAELAVLNNELTPCPEEQ